MTPQPSHGVNSQVKKDMKPEIIDELDSGRRHTEEPVIAVKRDSKLSSQPPPQIESHADKPLPVQNGVQEKSESSPIQNRTNKKSHTSPQQRRGRVASSPQQNVNDKEVQRSTTQTESDVSPQPSKPQSESPTRIQQRGRSSSQQLETSVDSPNIPQQNGSHRYARHISPSRHSHRTSKETLIDDPQAISPVESYKTSPPVRRGRRGRSNSADNYPLTRSQSDMTVNNKPTYHSLNIPDGDRMKHGDS